LDKEYLKNLIEKNKFSNDISHDIFSMCYSLFFKVGRH